TSKQLVVSILGGTPNASDKTFFVNLSNPTNATLAKTQGVGTITGGQPALTTVNPNSGQQGQTGLSVNLTGQLTHWVQGTTTISFGAGIILKSLTINSPTTATGVIDIGSGAAIGARDVTLTTGTEVVTLSGSFTVKSIAINVTETITVTDTPALQPAA